MSETTIVLSHKELEILADKDGQWFVKRGDTILYLVDEKPIMALPLLEYCYQDALQKLGSTFPYQTLILLALTSQSLYWTSLAIDWLELSETQIDKTVLQNLMLDRSLPQPIRHRIKKLFYS